MRSIRDIVEYINCEITKVMPWSYKGYGVAKTAIRETEILPVINEVYIGIDDIYAIQLYHKVNGITITQAKGGYGDAAGDATNIYKNSLIIFNDESKTKLMADQIALLIQSVVPKNIPTDFFRSVRVSLTNVILNSQQIYAQEYKSDSFRLNEYQTLTQIDYTVEVSYKNGCLDICPEDLTTCKN